MNDSIKLNAINLPSLPGKVKVPGYDRSKIKTGIVHVGVGNFHRAHEAFYTEQCLQKGETKWGICGVGLLENDRYMYEILRQQDGLYSLMVLKPDDSLSVWVIGAIVEYLLAPENPEAVLEKMADPNTKIISLTITEGGYNYDSTKGNFKSDEPEILWDLKYPYHPKTVFGFLTQALKRRRDRGLPGLTVLSCDNIQSNGDVCKKMLLTYVKEAEPGLIDWIENYVTFPNSMVDRITPVTTPSDMEKLKTRFGIEDGWPVVCEPFIQWIGEDDFSYGRPKWELAGAQFVQEVEPYERMKIRLLNGGHSLLGFSGALAGYQTIDETIGDPLLASFLSEFMDKEVTPIAM